MVRKSESSLHGRFVIQKGIIRLSFEQNKGKWTSVRKIEMFIISGARNIESLLYILKTCTNLVLFTNKNMHAQQI